MSMLGEVSSPDAIANTVIRNLARRNAAFLIQLRRRALRLAHQSAKPVT